MMISLIRCCLPLQAPMILLSAYIAEKDNARPDATYVLVG